MYTSDYFDVFSAHGAATNVDDSTIDIIRGFTYHVYSKKEAHKQGISINEVKQSIYFQKAGKIFSGTLRLIRMYQNNA